MRSSIAPTCISHLPREDISSLQFTALTKDQIESISVVEITEHYLYQNGKPKSNGLLDGKLGIGHQAIKCETCGELNDCPGHFGHISLNEPVYHYGYLQRVVEVLRCICHRCFKLKRCRNKQGNNKMKQIRKISDPEKRFRLLQNLLRQVKKCQKRSDEQDPLDKNFNACGSAIPTKIVMKGYNIYCSTQNEQNILIPRKQVIRLLEAFSYSSHECQILGFTRTKPIDLIIETVLVGPPQIRPIVYIRNESAFQDEITRAYSTIVRKNKQLSNNKINMLEKNILVDQIEKIINCIMMKVKSQKSNKKEKWYSIKNISERLKGKQGRFRQNLLGKRVDFSARTVITPDPSIDLHQIGIPEKLAQRLTYPEKVTPYNIDKIAQMCFKSKVKCLISSPQAGLGNKKLYLNVQKINATCQTDYYQYLQYGMIAERVLQDGDFVLVNRQPTLHKSSMMAHKVKILPFGTFRLNLSVCSPYNADFDGDEMNVHIPQSYESVSELKNVSYAENMVVGQKNGTVQMGFSQDSLLGLFMFTSKNTFLRKEQAQNLLMWIKEELYQNSDNGMSLPLPSIFEPEPLWTGKQIASLLLPKFISLKMIRSQDKRRNFLSAEQCDLLLLNGELLCGLIQKQNIGIATSSNNIIHIIWMEKGPLYAESFISSFQKLIYNWLLDIGFSLGAADIVPFQGLFEIKQISDQKVKKIYQHSINHFRDKKYLSQNHLHQQGKKIFDSFQFSLNMHLNNHLSTIQEQMRSTQRFKCNNIYRIVSAKSKGSETNLAQILFSVGNQNINGERCPLGFSKRSLPHFHKDDFSPPSRGYVSSSFYEGLNPSQFFFHSMAGREGLSDTAVKTSNVGYLQRKLIKSLQDLIVRYDSTVRDSNDNLFQNVYGQDGFSGEYIQKHRLESGHMKAKQFRQKYKWKQEQLKKVYKYTEKEVRQLQEQYYQLVKLRQIFLSVNESSNFDYFCPISVEKIINKVRKMKNGKKIIAEPFEIYQKLQQLLVQFGLVSNFKNNYQGSKVQQLSFQQQFQREDDPDKLLTANIYSRPPKINAQNGFSIFKAHLKFNLSSKIICRNYALSKEEFEELICEIKSKFFKSLIVGGESVGCLASQCVGEPLTQMTLNTFHLAGVSERNVTLGLPRLEKILNCGKDQENTKLIIFPQRAILQSQSNQYRNRQYLIDLLSYQFAERKIGEFIVSTNFKYTPSCQFQQRVKVLKRLPRFLKRQPWVVELNFSSTKISTKKMWHKIIEQIQKANGKLFEIDDYEQYNDTNSQNEQTKVVIRLLTNLESDSEKAISLHSQLEKVQKFIKQTSFCGIPGISSVKLSKKKVKVSSQIGQKQFVVFVAEGRNLKKCLAHFQVNSARTCSNNTKEIEETLGIQAARQSLLNQFIQVLKPYGININYRHLSLLVDWMTTKGVIIPANKHGMNKIKNVCTLTRASFQTADKTLFNAAVFSKKDDTFDTSQKIILGQTTSSGTSQCQIVIDTQKCSTAASKPPVYKRREFCENTLDKNMISPKYEETNYENYSYFSMKSNRNNSISAVSPNYANRSIMFSPIASFSPMHSPINLANTKSPLYSQDIRYQNRRVTMGSSDYSPQYQLAHTSSTYKNRQNEGNRKGLLQQKKQQENQEETQRTVLMKYKQDEYEDQF